MDRDEVLALRECRGDSISPARRLVVVAGVESDARRSFAVPGVDRRCLAVGFFCKPLTLTAALSSVNRDSTVGFDVGLLRSTPRRSDGLLQRPHRAHATASKRVIKGEGCGESEWGLSLVLWGVEKKMPARGDSSKKNAGNRLRVRAREGRRYMGHCHWPHSPPSPPTPNPLNTDNC
jgi:hypothetical protein